MRKLTNQEDTLLEGKKEIDRRQRTKLVAESPRLGGYNWLPSVVEIKRLRLEDSFFISESEKPKLNFIRSA